MGIIDASLGRYLNSHPELRPQPYRGETIMTLSQWCAETETRPTNEPNGRDPVSLKAALGTPKFSVLFNLEDYRVIRNEESNLTLIPTRLN